MCRTVQSILQSLICTLQMITRIFMTVLLMIENMIRMLLQSIYNFISTILQIISLLPICCVFLITARLKCFLCGSGGGCGGGGGGGGILGCVFSLVFLVGVLYALKQTNLVDSLLKKAGYVKVSRRTTTQSIHGLRRASDSDESTEEAADVYADIDNDTTTTQLPLDSFQPATEHNKAGNWSTILYYLL